MPKSKKNNHLPKQGKLISKQKQQLELPENTLNSRVKTKQASKKVLRGFPPHLQMEKAFNQNGPTYFGIHLRPRCNFHCQKCFIGEMKKLSTTNPTLSINEIFKIMTSAKEAGALVFGITGVGEPFTDQRIRKIILKAHQLGFITILVTNASMLNHKNICFLKEHDVTLALSLDTTDVNEFIKATGTTQSMFYKVLANIELAQKIYANTKVTKIINSKPMEIYRIAIHTTCHNFCANQLQEIQKLILPDTLFSISPIADAGNAKKMRHKKITSLTKILSEKHIVLMQDQETKQKVCGFFRLGVDMNFDGQFLIDAHALESRGLLGNIRDLNYNLMAAFKRQEPLKRKLTAELLNDNFCPVRAPKLNTWLKSNVITTNHNLHKK